MDTRVLFLILFYFTLPPFWILSDVFKTILCVVFGKIFQKEQNLSKLPKQDKRFFLPVFKRKSLVFFSIILHSLNVLFIPERNSEWRWISARGNSWLLINMQKKQDSIDFFLLTSKL